MSEVDTDTDAPKPGKSRKKLLVLVAAAVLLGAGGAGTWFSGLLPRFMGHGNEAHAEAGEHGATGTKEAKAEPAAPVSWNCRTSSPT